MMVMVMLMMVMIMIVLMVGMGMGMWSIYHLWSKQYVTSCDFKVVVVTPDETDEASLELEAEDETPFVSKRTTLSEDAMADFVTPQNFTSSKKSSRSSRKW